MLLWVVVNRTQLTKLVYVQQSREEMEVLFTLLPTATRPHHRRPSHPH
jgi:hypothetical protein